MSISWTGENSEPFNKNELKMGQFCASNHNNFTYPLQVRRCDKKVLSLEAKRPPEGGHFSL
jgi:hypothetical protein